MLERLPYFRLHVADYLLDTRGLTLEEHGIYCLLMFNYYWTGSIPQEIEDIKSMIGAHTPSAEVALDRVLAKFFKLEGDRIVHRRVDRELEKMKAFFNKQHNAAAASVAARAKTPAKPRLPVKEKLNGAFSEFWSAYPRKAGKGAAEKAWLKISPDEVLSASIIGAIALQADSDQWKKDEGKFIPHPATWLNQRRWEDEQVSAEEVVNARCYYCPRPATKITNDIPHCSEGRHIDWAKAGSR